LSSALSALALLKTSWDYNRKDHLDSLMPHFATVVARKAFSRVDPEKMSRAFQAEWGWNIPVYVMQGLMARAESLGLINRSDRGDWIPVRERIADYEYRDAAAAAQEQIRNLAEAYAKYRETRSGDRIETAEAEKVLLAFLSQYDLEIVSGSRTGGLLETNPARGAELYSVGDFLLRCYSDRRDLFESARQLALAQVFASTLTVSNLDSYKGAIEGLCAYLDTRVILQALGIYGEDRMRWVREFLGNLRQRGAVLRVFDHTYDEMKTIIENCKPYVESASYNASIASHACRYFREVDASESDVEEFVLRLRGTLEALCIEYIDGAYDSSDNEFQIEEEALQKAIKSVYSEGNRGATHSPLDDTVHKDVRSIALVHRMRHGAKPQKLSEAQHVFVTTNSGLARASYNMEVEESGGGIVVPDAVRDVFLATLVWMQAPSGFEVIDASRFLADCHAAISVDDALVTRFLNKVESLRERGEIDDEAYYQLRMHRYALRVLGDVTLGDLDKVTDQTPLEVLARIEDRIRWEAEKKLRDEQEYHAASIAVLEAKILAGISRELEAEEKIRQLNTDVATTKSQHEVLVQTIAGWAASALAWPLFVVVVVCGLIAYFGDFFQGKPALQQFQKVFTFLFLVLSVLSLLNGFNIAGVRERLRSRFTAALSKRRIEPQPQEKVD